MFKFSGGDARDLLNELELAVETTLADADGVILRTLDIAQESIQKRALLYDRNGDQHYDTVSAFIKSVRGSDPDAALYWLAKMLAAGEDPRFILRRLIILASEDIGLADPQGILVASAAANVYEYIGLPEGVFPIVEATLYLATAPKSNSVGAYWQAVAEIEEHGYRPPPVYLRDTHTLLDSEKHLARAYKYPHDYPTGWVKQRYLPEGVEGGWFRPKGHGHEQRILETLKQLQQEK